MSTHPFYRIRRLPPYVFAEVNRMKADARAAGRDIIDFGMGNPDTPPAPHIIRKLQEVAADPKVHGYSSSRGIPGLRRAQAAYYARRFGVELDPETEVVVTLGSKEGLANLAQAMTRPGDVIMVPGPSYPIHIYGFVIADATVVQIPRQPDRPFIEQLKETVEDTSPKPVAVVVNYPCNPTSEVTTLDFYEELVDFCRFHGIYILSDLAYCEIYFDGRPPPSILQVKGAKEIAVEFTSMSKTYSMAGWRIGFTVGCPALVEALARIKSYVDYGAFTALQAAAAHALNGPQECVAEVRQLYKDRRDVLVRGLRRMGWDVPMPPASMFLWAPAPEQFAHMGSLEFSKFLLEKAEVAVAPGIGFGQHGEGFVRIGLVENRHRIRQALKNMRRVFRGA